MSRRGLGLILMLAAASTLAAEEGPQAWLGVYVDRAEAGEGSDGIPIKGIVTGSPADRAGLRARDRIVALETRRIASAAELFSTLRAMEADRWVSLTVQRGGEEFEVDARLRRRPAQGDYSVRVGWIGIEAIDLPGSLRRLFGAPEDAGVMLSLVEPGSPAEAAGLLIGDVVFEAGGAPIGSVVELVQRVRTGGVGNTLEITLARDGLEEIIVEPIIGIAPD